MEREQISYEPSIYDDLYFELTGSYLPKEGAAYEKISTAVIGILQKKGVSHDQRIRGKSGSIYQIDGLVDQIIMVEAKDYAKRNTKVGRGDLQKQEGALTDLDNIKEGYFASATDFTSPAIKYAKGTNSNDMQKVIKTFNIRKSTEDDKKGRIQVIKVHMVAQYPEFRPDSFRLIWHDETTFNEFNKCMGKIEFINEELQIESLYDEHGELKTSISELSKSQQPKFMEKDTVVEGKFVIDAYIKMAGRLFHIDGISYIADIITLLNDFDVTKEGNAIVLAKCDDLDINTLVTDQELRDALIAINK